MNIFKEATKTKHRIPTANGMLTAEQCWDLSLTKLANSIKQIKKKLKSDNDDELSFLDETKTIDKEAQLSFEILKDIYVTKKEESDAAKQQASIKAHNEKIDAIIYQKQQSQLNDLSIDELLNLKK